MRIPSSLDQPIGIIAIGAASWVATGCDDHGGHADAVGQVGVDADAQADSVRDVGSGGDGDTDANGQHTDCDRYEPVEIVVSSATEYGNPYVDVTLTALVTPPAGSGESPYRVPGFWDGGSTWRVRFAPREAGTYVVTLECSNPSDSGLHGRSFSFTASDRFSPTWAPRGFVHVDPTTTYYFTSDDGTPFLWVGDTAWINLYERAWDQPIFTDANWRALCDHRSEQGFTVVQSVVYNDSEHWDDGARPFVDDDPDRVHPTSWQRVDGRVQYAVQRGLMMYLMTSSNGMHFAWPEEQRERLYRYMVARYAAYNVAFGGGEEVDRGGFGSDEAYRHMIETLHTLDPYRRLVALHAEGVGTKILPGEVDFLLIQYYTRDVSYAESTTSSRDNGRPFVVGETWYYHNGKPGMNDPVTIREMAWRIFLGGAAGYTYGHMGLVVPTASSHPDRYDMSDLTDESAEEMRRIAAWLRQPGLAWWTFSRFEDLGSGRYLTARPGHQYVIMTERDDGIFNVDLSDAPGTLSGRWYDIAADAYGDTVTVEATASATIDPPGPWHVIRLDIEP